MHCKQFVSLSVASLMLAAVLTGCGGASSTASSAVSSEAASAVSAAASEPAEAALPDGVYTAEFDTDSGMFHANEACNGMGADHLILKILALDLAAHLDLGRQQGQRNGIQLVALNVGAAQVDIIAVKADDLVIPGAHRIPSFI